jgi:hypothetical protein
MRGEGILIEQVTRRRLTGIRAEETTARPLCIFDASEPFLDLARQSGCGLVS